MLLQFWKRSTIVLAACFAVSNAQPSAEFFEYFDEPQEMWGGQTTDTFGQGVFEGNGVYMSPDGNLLVSTTYDATIRAFDPKTGEVKWTYTPTTLGLPIRCFSGVTFNYEGVIPYIVFAVADGANDPNNNPIATSRIIALNVDGGEIFQSTSVQGVVAGTPVTDFSGNHILFTHNEDKLKGYMSIMYVGNAQGSEPVSPMFTGTYPVTDGNSTLERPFSPLGFFHKPEEGYYDGGQENSNDFFMFAWDTPRTATSVNAGEGQKFAFQFPVDYLQDGQGDLSFFLLGGATDYHASTPPVITNAGRSYYWSVTKSNQDCLVGVDALPRFRFDRDRITRRVSLSRGDPRYRSSRVEPTLSSDPAEPMVYGVGASTEIWRMDYQYSEGDRDIVATTDIVSSKMVLTPQENFVLYGTQSTVTPGGLYMHRASDLQQTWELSIEGGVAGDMAVDKVGTMIYVANPTGVLTAYQFAEDNTPSEAPSSEPTYFTPTASPTTGAPSAFPSVAPSLAPSAAPSTPAPTMAPTTAAPTTSAMPSSSTKAPTIAPTGSPTTAAPTAAPVTPAPTDVPVTGTPVAAAPEPAPSDREITDGDGESSAFALSSILSFLAAGLVTFLI